MLLSPMGLLVAAVLVLVDYRLHGRWLVALLGSLAFGATAFATLPSLGGSSPLIYALFSLAIIASIATRSDFAQTVRLVFRHHPVSWAVLFLMIYVAAGSYISPRLFQNDTLVFVSTRTGDGAGVIRPVPLAPQNGNVSQGAYFVLGALTFFAVCITLRARDRLESLRIAGWALAVLVAATGLLDLAGKLIGAGDVLEPIRTASYSMMTSEEHAVAGYARINGAFSEASSFAGILLPSLAFTVAYWRKAPSHFALSVSLVLVGLLVLSTSTTAYVTVAVAVVGLAVASGAAILGRGHIRAADLLLVGLALAFASIVLAIYLADDRLFAPFLRLLDLMVFNKASSDSAIERGSWNAQALQNLFDTRLLGVGIGSARTSSWAVAVASQLGVIGLLLMASLVVSLFRSGVGITSRPETRSIEALLAGCRAAALVSLIPATLASPTPDPGVLFFVMLAAAVVCRRHIERTADSADTMSQAIYLLRPPSSARTSYQREL